MHDTPQVDDEFNSRQYQTHQIRIIERWRIVELIIATAMMLSSIGVFVFMMNWPTVMSGMNYWLLIIPYVSLTCALFTAQALRRHTGRQFIE